jgi:NAD(P)-dependent dehydrogenase (short-subunit alcohol dehydrogenase family)
VSTQGSQPRRVFAPDLMAGQAALVTGGGTGLGRVIAQALAECGADLLLAARQSERLEEAAREIRASTGRRVEVSACNIRERESIEALAGRAVELYGQIDVLVNNAGGQFPSPARSIRPKGWHAVIDLNLTGTWNMTQVFGNQMLDGRGGSIVNVIAVVGRGFPGLAHTAAARAGVLELTRTLAYEWGAKVRLNCVAPGPFRTAGFDATYDLEQLTGMDSIPTGRFGEPREAAHAVVFLASPAASYITGEVLYVAGGQQLYGRNQALLDASFERPKRPGDPTPS